MQPVRSDPPSERVLQWVTREVDPSGRIATVGTLRGGITAQMNRITVECAAGAVEVILRRWPDDGWADGLVTQECEALQAAVDIDVPVPRLLAADADGDRTGVRCTLTTALPGAPDLAPQDPESWLDQLAAAQVAIHRSGSVPTRRWVGWYEPDTSLDWIADEGLRRAAREAAGSDVADEGVLVHGDYQHFNILWSAGKLTGVVDWTNGARGNRGTDVGHCRLNLAVLFDAAAAAEYLRRYEQFAGTTVDRRADLRALLHFGDDWPDFIPVQVAGRTVVDLRGMADRVTEVVRAAVDAVR